MAGRNRAIPVPPPAPGVIQIDDHDMHQVPQGPPMNNQPNIAQRRVNPNFQHPDPVYRPGPQYGPGMIINNSIRISDITPRKELSEEYCRQQLTTYQVETIKKTAPKPLDSEEKISKKKETRRSSFGFRESKGPKKPKATWERVQFNKENFSTEEIIRKIEKLNKKRSITDKVAKLKPNQSSQVTILTESILDNEHEPQWFTWNLAQLDRTEATNSKGEKEIAKITCFFKRSPKPEVDVIAMYQQRRPRPSIGQPFPLQPMGQPHIDPNRPLPPPDAGYRGPPRGASQEPLVRPRRGSRPPSVRIIDDRDRRGPQRDGNRRHSDSSSSSESDSETDNDSMYASDTPPSSPGPGHRGGEGRRGYVRRRNTGPRYHDREAEFVVVERPRRYSSVAYASEAPRYYDDRAVRDSDIARNSVAEAAEAIAASIITAAQMSSREPLTPPGSVRQRLPSERDLRDRLDDDRRRDILDDRRRDILDDRRRDYSDDIFSRDSTVSPRQIDMEDILLRRNSRRPSELPPRSSMIDNDFEYIQNPMLPRNPPIFRYTERIP